MNITLLYDKNHLLLAALAIFLNKFSMMKEFKFNPLRKILVPTDFSDNADHALNYAAVLASKLRSKLVLFHSVKFPVVAMNEMVVEVPDSQLIKESNVKLEKLKHTIRGKQVPVEIETSSSVGFAVDEIINYCQSKKSDMIVMGTKGAHGLGELLLGSNTAEVIAKAKCPVLAVPPDAKVKDIKKILFATNYADNDFQSIFLLTEIFKPWNPEIIIVHVEDPHNARTENSHFEHFKSQVMTSISYDKFYFNLLDGKNVEEAISDFAIHNSIDIISVSARRRNLFEKLTGRSTTKKMSYHTHIPLLAFHAEQVGGTPLFL